MVGGPVQYLLIGRIEPYIGRRPGVVNRKTLWIKQMLDRIPNVNLYLILIYTKHSVNRKVALAFWNFRNDIK
jgi:hypothetical protein